MADRPLIAHHRASAASGVEMMSTQVHNRLSSSRFINMCVANWFLHIFIFAIVPLLAVLVENLGGTPAWTGYAVLAFAVGMVIPGPFGAHLMERRSRKEVFLKAALVAGPVVTLLGYMFCVHSLEGIVALQLLQGMAFGVAQTALGTTLVNDILLSKQRNRGDIIYGWAGRLGIPLGLFLGYILLQVMTVDLAFWWTLVPCALAFLLVAQTTVPVKAPVKVPLVTLDRFFLPSSMHLGLTMFAAPWVFGRMAGLMLNAWPCLCMALGVLAAFLMQLFVRRRMGQRGIVSFAYLLIMLALCMLPVNSFAVVSVAYGLLGFGVGAVSSRHLMDWVTSAQHCQRGTVQNTYILTWRMAFSLGFLFSACGVSDNYTVDFALCAVGLAAYVLWVGPKAGGTE